MSRPKSAIWIETNAMDCPCDHSQDERILTELQKMLSALDHYTVSMTHKTALSQNHECRCRITLTDQWCPGIRIMLHASARMVVGIIQHVAPMPEIDVNKYLKAFSITSPAIASFALPMPERDLCYDTKGWDAIADYITSVFFAHTYPNIIQVR